MRILDSRDVPVVEGLIAFIERGSVADLLRDKSVKLSFKQRMSFARDAALGMNWLHNASPPILHLDLKCSNLLGMRTTLPLFSCR